MTPQNSVEEAGYSAPWVPLDEGVMDPQARKQKSQSIQMANFY